MTTLLSRRVFLKSLAVATDAASQSGLAGPGGGRSLRQVTRVAIHPAVGIARVGNSPDYFFFGPELPGTVPRGPYKDPQGAMAKQAARFRLYGYDDRGRVVRELTAAEADFTWHVNVANAKAAWYTVDTAFDVPGAPSVARRNSTVADRRSLVIRATPRSLMGPGAGPVALDGGLFSGIPVTLGEVLTDAQGRLLVLPGSGAAYSTPDAPPLGGFADNDGWTDDTCDGPIGATVRIGDRVFDADPAWVVCGSPNYAPGLPEGLVTLHDAIESGLVEAGVRAAGPTDFYRDIWPIFQRITDMQWVNAGYLASHGFGSSQDWTQPRWRRRLANPLPANQAFRLGVLATFRNPAFATVDATLEPQLYGDKVTMPPNAVEPRQWLSLTPLQYQRLQDWANGQFTRKALPRPTHLAGLSLQQRPAALDEAALTACLGGAFHPGVEFPWIARVPWIWTADLRLRGASGEPDLHDYGPTLNAAVALSRQGPLAHLGPGGVTQWMGVPWHADSASCRYGYQRAISPVLPGFWPARIPNGVLSEADYERVMDTDLSLEERRAAFARRRDWERFIAAPTRPPTLALMVQECYRLGLVSERRGPRDGHFPRRMKVESAVGYATEPPVEYGAWWWVPQLPMFPIIVANSDDNSLRAVDAEGQVRTLALNGPLERPEGLVRDRLGNLYAACMDSGTVKKVSPAGGVSTFASGLQAPLGLAFAPNGTLYVSNYLDDGWIAAISPEGQLSVLVPPGSGLARPVGLTVTPDGVLLVSLSGTGAIARIDPVTGAILNPSWITGLNGPRGMAFDAAYRLYVALRFDNTVRRFDMQGAPVPLTLQGAELGLPFGIAFDAQGNLYLSNSADNLIQRITFADQDTVGFVSDFAAGLPNPGGLAFNG